MKLILTLFLFTALAGATACKNEKKEDKPAPAETETKTPAPQKVDPGMKESTRGEFKVHSCTENCKDGQHVFVHGEDGHTCSEECMKTNG